MAYDKLLAANPGVWTITLTQNSATASVAGILLLAAGAREGDAVLDDEGHVLVIKALTETEITFAWPYKATTRTIDLVIEERSINRAINTASSAAAIAALARLQNAANLAPNYPVLSHSSTPPSAPADGDRHLVGPAPTGLWADKAKHLALYSAATTEWSFTPPEDGMSILLAGTSARLQYNGATWGLDALGANGGRLTGPLDWASAVDVASAPAVDLGTVHSNLVNVTGATTIVAFGIAANGVWRLVRFAGALTLMHGASLALPTGANIATATGDWALFVSRGEGTWHCAGYTRMDGTPLALGAGTVATSKLADQAVSNAKLADMAGGTIKLRASGAGSGPPTDGTPAQTRAILGLPAPGAALPIADGGTGGSTVAAASAAVGINAGDLIINGRFAINQRVYVSGATRAAGAYAHDRWKAGAGGCAYTFAQQMISTQVTITAGTLLQIVEAVVINGGAYTLSWTGTAQARIYQGAASGVYAASPVTITGLAGATNTTIEFGVGTLANVQLQAGSVASPITPRPAGQELVLCQRYYEKSYALSVAPGTSGYSPGYTASVITPAGNSAVSVQYKATKRAPPNIVVYSPHTGTAGQASDGGNVTAAAVPMTWTEGSFGIYTPTAGLTANSYMYTHWTADAEI